MNLSSANLQTSLECSYCVRKRSYLGEDCKREKEEREGKKGKKRKEGKKSKKRTGREGKGEGKGRKRKKRNFFFDSLVSWSDPDTNPLTGSTIELTMLVERLF